MKTYELFIEATEEQARASNPNASPELIRRAAERSQRSAAQREGKQKTTQNSIQKGLKSLPAADKGSAIVRQKQGGTGKEAFGAPKKSGPGVGSTKSQYKTGPIAIRDKPGSLAKRDISKPSEKQAGSRPGTTRDGWGVKPRGDFKSPGNAPHDGAKTISAYDRARKARDIENQLDKEDKNKGKCKKFAKKA